MLSFCRFFVYGLIFWCLRCRRIIDSFFLPFFLLLPICPSKMCLKVFRHIFVLPITHLGSCYAHFGPIMEPIPPPAASHSWSNSWYAKHKIEPTVWFSEGKNWKYFHPSKVFASWYFYFTNYRSKMYITTAKFVYWGSKIEYRGQGQRMKKRSMQYFCTTYNKDL